MSHDPSIVTTPLQDAKLSSEEIGGLRICMLAYAFYESDTRILQYATALAQRGDTVDVIALRRDLSLPEYEVLNGVNVYRIQSRVVNEKGVFSYATRILRFFFHSIIVLHRRQKQSPYDLVHVHNVPDPLVFATVFSKLKHVPIILDIHDLLPEFYASKFKIDSRGLLFKFLIRLERYSAAFATHVIIANDLWLDRLTTRSCSREKCNVVRNRPDLSIFQKHDSVRKITDKFVLIYPGSLNWHQGLDIAIRAFASVSDQMRDAEFHIYGEGSAKASLIELANDLKMQKQIIFHNFLPSREIAQVMAVANLAIEPKRCNSAFSNEALSTKIMEFMSLGVPVIACRTKVHAYYYDDSIISYYENDNENELAQRMLLLMNSSSLRAELVKNAGEYVRANTWDARKSEYTRLVDSLIVGKAPNNAASKAAINL
jgi:glycosyltransferase involved in cell wall biosynthesis